jgi:hypothetical protein
MKMLKSLRVIALLAISLFSSVAQSYSQDFMMQGWFWDYPKTTASGSWINNLNAKATDLSTAGFTYIWLPPLPKASSGSNSNGYDPRDLFDFGEYNGGCRWGTRAELNTLISTFNNKGLNAVSDVIYNHRDGGLPENNPAVKAYINSPPSGASPFPSDRVRCVLPLSSTSGNGAGDYYIKFSSQSGGYGGKPYKLYIQTSKTGWQNLADLNEDESIVNPTNASQTGNGGSDCGQYFNTITLGRNLKVTVDNSGCRTDEFKLTLNAGDFNPSDSLFIYFANENGDYSDHRIYGIWNAARSQNVINDLVYQTYTDFTNMPSGMGSMNYLNFKPNGITNTTMNGDLDAPLFFYDYEQAYSSTQTVLNDWTKWNWTNVGIRGFRMDAVKHFPASLVSNLLNDLNAKGINPGMVVGESFDGNPSVLKGWIDAVYSGMNTAARNAIKVRIFDFDLRYALKEICDFGADARNVYTRGVVNAANGSGLNVVSFLNNHDFRDASGGNSLIQNNVMLGYAYILTDNRVGLPCVFYPDYYSTTTLRNGSLKPQIDALIAKHKQYIAGANQLEYLNKAGSTYLSGSNYISGSANKTMIYQIKGGAAGKDVIVAINFSSQTLKLDQLINTSGNPTGTRFTDVLGQSAFPYAQVNGSGQIYAELPPNSYSMWVQGSVVLPVEMLDFKVNVVKNNNALLTWNTASEKDNSRFEVEHSSNGKDFVKIGEVKGKGTTLTATNYDFTDKNLNNGTHYYRLRQIDFDSKNTLSQVLSVSINKVHKIKIYPNPASDKLFIQRENTPSEGQNTEGVVSIIDQLGRAIMSYKTIPAEINISALPVGIYFLQIDNERIKFVKK